MKRILMMAVVMGVASMLMIWATPGQLDKNFWCHYPPGQWTGDPATSKVLILSIDDSADPGHLGHSPTLPLTPGTTTPPGPACNPASFNGSKATGCAEGVPLDPTDANTCPGLAGNPGIG